MTRVLLALIAALVVWGCLATWGVLHLRGKNATVALELRQTADALERAQSARKRSEATLVSLRRKNAATAASAALAQRSLQRALTDSPDWAQTPVPKEVQDAFK